MDVAYGEVRDRIERIRPSLPQEMEPRAMSAAIASVMSGRLSIRGIRSA